MPKPAHEYRRADNPPDRAPKRLRHRFFHDDFPSWIADSFRGIVRAIRLGYRWSDTNYLTTKDGHLVNCHWQRPLQHGWHDRARVLAADTPIYRMTLAEVRRLRSRTGDYRIHTAEEMVARAGRDGLRLEFELKRCIPAPSYERACSVMDVARRFNTELVVKTLTRPGTTAEAIERLTPFHRAGAKTCILPRGSKQVPRTSWLVVDYVRGKVRWTGPTAKES